MTIQLYQGDCTEVMRTLPDGCVDSVVTDPPYGLEFMSVAWDTFSDRPKGSPRVPNTWGDHGSKEHARHPSEAGRVRRKKGVAFQEFTETWAAECLRVLKPGGYLLAFGGARTYHRLAVAVEDAGFEIRDQIMWLYGSGFPKSLNVQQAINKAARGCPQGASDPKSPNHGKFKSGCSAENTTGRGFGAGAGAYMREQGGARGGDEGGWQGWGTALKPAHEPIILARKPLASTVAENVQEHGTGALNIDGCRVGDFVNTTPSGVDRRNARLAELGYRPGEYRMGEKTPNTPPGRWPANVMHDGSDEVLAEFAKHGEKGAAAPVKGTEASVASAGNITGRRERVPGVFHADNGTAARFFYCAKASKADRGEGNTHPTVKPTALMRYLCRLVTPPGGIVLDPFMGSGSTGKAAVAEGFNFIGIERETEYLAIARKRLEGEPQLAMAV